MSEEKKKRGRPPLPPEMKAEQIKARRAASASWHKQNGYSSQRNYREKHRGERYDLRVSMPAKNKSKLLELSASLQKSPSELFFDAIFTQYGIDLKNSDD